MIGELGTVASSVYVIGNLFRIYIIGMFFRVFFDVAASRNRRIVRCVCYIVYYVGNSMCFLLLACPLPIIMLSNFVGSLLVAACYVSTWKYRIIAMIASVERAKSEEAVRQYVKRQGKQDEYEQLSLKL